MWEPPSVSYFVSKWDVSPRSCFRWADIDFAAIMVPANDGRICGWALRLFWGLPTSMCIIYAEWPLATCP